MCCFSPGLHGAVELTLSIFNRKRGNLLESGKAFHNLSLYFKGCFEIPNKCVYDAYLNVFVLQMKQRNISSA